MKIELCTQKEPKASSLKYQIEIEIVFISIKRCKHAKVMSLCVSVCVFVGCVGGLGNPLVTLGGVGVGS